jgi:hypothetical protein
MNTTRKLGPPDKSAAQNLAEVLDRDCPEHEIGRVLRECLSATTISRSGIVEPDFKTRLAAATFITTQRHGLPVRREEILTVSVDADAEAGLAQRLKSSPALRQVFRRVLDEIDAGPVIEA